MKFWNIKKQFKKLKKDIKFKKTFKSIDASLKEISFFENNSFSFEESSDPKVSIIIPVYNQIHYTLNCLYSIFQNEDHIPKEIIVVNDCSTDDTAAIISKIKGVKLINNQENLGFLKSVNKAIQYAEGEFVYLLNNDTKVQKNYLSVLLEVFSEQKNVGAVGSKLIFSNSTLQEAGCLVFKNEIIVNRGATQSIDAPQFSFIRKVDYASGCSLLFKRKDAEGNLNLFDEVFAPAYYEENDLCMTLKHKQGLEIYYQPKSEILHFENVSYQNISLDKKNLLNRNSKIFYEKWTNYLKTNWKEGPENYRINDNKGYDKSILIVEEYMPKFDQDSGSNRFTEIVKILIANNHKVYLLIKNGVSEGDFVYLDMFQKLGVEVIRDYLTPKKMIIRAEKQLKQIRKAVDFIWIFRPEGYEYYLDVIQKIGFDAKIIYDMVDLHYLRFDREKDFFTKTRRRQKREKEVRELEQKALQNADVIVAISEQEKEILINEGFKKDNIFIVSNIHSVKTNITQKPFSERDGLVFIGGFNHKPNIDSVIYLHHDIMPLVWKENKDIKVYIIGGSVPDEIKALHSPQFQILGYQQEIDDYFTTAKAFVAPLRYGAGVKGKIGQALEYQIPVISTTIGVEGMKLKPNVNALVVEISDPEAFAKNILEIYTNEEKWNNLHKNSEDGLSYFSIKKQDENIKEIFEYLIK
ncbi:Glycosyltransferase, GT2 family [Soonwooa buanensis]|uniref:Glycosyltransferase, GT2 family n=1 Tax=Soonwooa buanensis TaxID=619805 RepID=A0A1T5FLL2_9FLAO|nr:glycosyltransferase [Soonwooa buanensis]SKB97114.1 Glycosyltransferase, GT2 family [Soonwooa buanensis]